MLKGKYLIRNINRCWTAEDDTYRWLLVTSMVSRVVTSIVTRVVTLNLD